MATFHSLNLPDASLVELIPIEAAPTNAHIPQRSPRRTARPATRRNHAQQDPSPSTTPTIKLAQILDRLKKETRAEHRLAEGEVRRAYLQGKAEGYRDARDLLEGIL